MTEKLRRLTVCMDIKPDELSSAYRRRSLLVHPDKYQKDPSLVKLATEAFNILVDAGKIMQNPADRELYNNGLKDALTTQLMDHQRKKMKESRKEAIECNYASAEKSFL